MIYTIGHSTRPEKDFLDLLQHYAIKTLIDIRTIPRSRWNPQFNRTSLEKSLPKAGVTYMHMAELGGLREPSAKSIHVGLKNPGLRGYADHMQSTEFDQALAKVIGLGRKQTIALMCAEADYIKCHRQLTSDALVARKVKVHHILNADEASPHALTRSAHIDGKRITYGADQSKLEF
jgi:uncharacterized protein (DUF488 family)